MDYWKECISEAFEDAGIVATKEQIDTATRTQITKHDHVIYKGWFYGSDK